jgi:hypothetical protein
VIDASGIHRLGTERLQIMAALCAMDATGRPHGATPAEISDFLHDQCGVPISRQRVSAVLSKEISTVARRRIRKRWHYKVMKAGEIELEAIGQATIFIEPETGLSKIRQTEEVFNSLKGTIRICDPYVDNRTLDFLAQARHADAIRLLTVTITHGTAFRRDLAAFKSEHGDRLEVRISSKNDLHDRFIVWDEGVWAIGTSLNGLGRKQSLIVPLGNDLREILLQAFDRQWNSSKAYK